ncbi:Hypothetical protein NTJ_06768 [Nesidiocoris tenuis]|uniref:Uncharacterized protein n=1 Tax=Nesidiocoris tenuis TaxID=355587 RepID=A0ABN7ARN8_9HEMI|nr:Hypothetical protein NTJ_06768 [Nesidiocoris tenuis]
MDLETEIAKPTLLPLERRLGRAAHNDELEERAQERQPMIDSGNTRPDDCSGGDEKQYWLTASKLFCENSL